MQHNLKSAIAVTMLAICAGATFTAAHATTSGTFVQPFKCDVKRTDGSSASFVSVSKQASVLDIVLVDEGDYAGALFGGCTPFTAAGNTVVVTVSPTASSGNLEIRLAAIGGASSSNTKNTTYTIAPTSVDKSSVPFVFTFDFDDTNVPATEIIKKLAVFAIQTGTSPGTVYMDTFSFNGTPITKKVMTTDGCL